MSGIFDDVEKRRKEIADDERRKLDREQSDLKKVLSLPEGRRLLWRLLAESSVFHVTYAEETNRTMFNEGRRSLGLLFLHDILRAKPEAFTQMQREAAASDQKPEPKKETL